jgi:hypothetical protein
MAISVAQTEGARSVYEERPEFLVVQVAWVGAASATPSASLSSSSRASRDGYRG